MVPYKDKSGESGAKAYEIGLDYIDIEYVSGKCYRYDSVSPGVTDLQAMKLLAESGEDLATYINKNVRKRFAQQLR